MVREARKEFFSKKSYNITTDGTCNHSGMFRQLAVSANLLGTSIHKIPSVIDWTWRTETSKLCFTLLTQRSKVSSHGTPFRISQSYGLTGIHNPDALFHFGGITYCPWCRKEGQNKSTMVNYLQTVHYRLGLVWNRCYVACPQCPTPSTTMAGMTAANPGGMITLSQFHPINLQESTTASAENPNKEVKVEWPT